MPAAPRDSSIISVNGTRRPTARAHVPYRANEHVQGRRTGLKASYVARDSDGIEDFNALLSQLDAAEQPRVKPKAKPQPTPKRPPPIAESEESEQEHDEYDVSMGPIEDSPPRRNTTRYPSTPTSNRRGPPPRTAMRISEIDYDAVPSPRRGPPVGPRKSHIPRKSSAQHNEYDVPVVSGGGRAPRKSSVSKPKRQTTPYARGSNPADDEEEDEDLEDLSVARGGVPPRSARGSVRPFPRHSARPSDVPSPRPSYGGQFDEADVSVGARRSLPGDGYDDEPYDEGPSVHSSFAQMSEGPDEGEDLGGDEFPEEFVEDYPEEGHDVRVLNVQGNGRTGTKTTTKMAPRKTVHNWNAEPEDEEEESMRSGKPVSRGSIKGKERAAPANDEDDDEVPRPPPRAKPASRGSRPIEPEPEAMEEDEVLSVPVGKPSSKVKRRAEPEMDEDAEDASARAGSAAKSAREKGKGKQPLFLPDPEEDQEMEPPGADYDDVPVADYDAPMDYEPAGLDDGDVSMQAPAEEDVVEDAVEAEEEEEPPKKKTAKEKKKEREAQAKEKRELAKKKQKKRAADEGEDENVEPEAKAKKSRPRSQSRPKEASEPLRAMTEDINQDSADDDMDSVDDAGLRRGRRKRYAPLDWWRLEKVEYGRGKELAEIKRIIKLPKEPTQSLGQRKRGAKRATSTAAKGKKGKGKAKSKDDEGDDLAFPEEGWDEGTKPEGVVQVFGTEVEVERRIVWPARLVNPRPAENNNFLFQKIFGDGEFIAAGQLAIPKGKGKPAKKSHDNTYVFYIIEGAVQFQVHQTNYVVCQGGMVLVPRGNSYAIKNMSDRTAKLFFAQARKVRMDEAEEAPQVLSRRSRTSDASHASAASRASSRG